MSITKMKNANRGDSFDRVNCYRYDNELTGAALATPPPHSVRARQGGAAYRRSPYFSSYMPKDEMIAKLFAMFMLAMAFTLIFTRAAFAQGMPLTLEQCVDMALRNNANIIIATEAIVAAEAAIDETEASRRPTVSANASYSIVVLPAPLEHTVSGFAPVREEPINPADPSMGSMITGLVPFQQTFRPGIHGFDVGITATQVLYTGGRITNARRIAEHSRTATEWQKRSAEREVRRDVTTTFYQALSVTKSVTALDSAISLMEASLRDMKNMVEVGMLGEHEVLLMEVELSNLRMSRQQAATGAQSIHDYLAVLIGVPVNSPITLVNELQAPDALTLPELTTLQTRSHAASSDLRALEEQLRIIDVSLDITNATHIPTIVAQAGYTGGIRTNGNVPDPDNPSGDPPFLTDWTNNAFIAVAAQWEIYGGGAVNQQRRQRFSQKRQLQLTIDNIRANLDMGVKTSVSSLQDAYLTIEVSRQSIAQARRSYEIANDKFQEGMIPSSELLRAQNSVLTSEISYYSALSTFYSRMAELEYLVSEQ